MNWICIVYALKPNYIKRCEFAHERLNNKKENTRQIYFLSTEDKHIKCIESINYISKI